MFRLVIMLFTMTAVLGSCNKAIYHRNQPYLKEVIHVRNKAEPTETIRNYKYPDGSRKCFNRWYMPMEYDKEIYRLPVYAGKLDNNNVQTDTIILNHGKSEPYWEKRIIDKNCIPDKLNDCRVLCLVDAPKISEKFIIVKDTTEESNYSWMTIENREYKYGISNEWREVLCNNLIDDEFYMNISRALIEISYLDAEDLNTLWTEKKKKAMRQYQIDNRLPVGKFDIESLDSLEIEYK